MKNVKLTKDERNVIERCLLKVMFNDVGGAIGTKERQEATQKLSEKMR